MLECVRGARIFNAHRWTRPRERISNGDIRTLRACDEAATACGSEQVLRPSLAASAQVDHALPRGMPRLFSRELHVQMVLIREVRPKHVEDIELGGNGRGGVGLTVLIRPERTFVGMCVGVCFRHARHNRIRENDGAVAGENVATIDAIAEQDGIWIREVVVVRVDFIESRVVACEHEWCPTHTRFARRCRDPERRVGRAEKEFGGRRFGRGAGAGREQSERREKGTKRGSHSAGKYTAWKGEIPRCARDDQR